MKLTKKELQALYDKAAQVRSRAKALAAKLESKPVTKSLTDAELDDAMRGDVGDGIRRSLLQRVEDGLPLNDNQRRFLEKALGHERAARLLKSQAPVMYKATDTELVYKAKEPPMKPVQKASNYTMQELYVIELLKQLFVKFGQDTVKRLLPAAADEFLVGKSLDAVAPKYDPNFGGLGVPLTPAQRAEYISVQKAKAASPHDPFFGGLGVPKKTR